MMKDEVEHLENQTTKEWAALQRVVSAICIHSGQIYWLGFSSVSTVFNKAD